MHVDDIKGAARRDIAESLSARLNKTVGQCKADYDSSSQQVSNMSTQPWLPSHISVYIYIYIDSITPIDSNSLIGKDEKAN